MSSVGCCISLLLVNCIMHGRRSGDQSDQCPHTNNSAKLTTVPARIMQAIGATTPVFTAVLAVAMMGKRETGIVYAALLPVVIGIVIATGAADPVQTTCRHLVYDAMPDLSGCHCPAPRFLTGAVVLCRRRAAL
jgi:drug/metabolite transporter (DMT)-like permease